MNRCAHRILGTKEKDINVVTTGRWEIFLGDLELWQKYPILGTGVGISQPLRENIRGVISHVEVSRLLAEHGILGLIYSVVLFFLFIPILKRNNPLIIKAILASIFFIGLFTTFHSATRTYISTLLIGISQITIGNFPVGRKSDTSRL